MGWIQPAAIAVIGAIGVMMTFFILLDHRGHKLEGHKRVFLSHGIIRLTEKYVRLDAPRRDMLQIGRLTDKRCLATTLGYPWAARLTLSTDHGELVMDLPLVEKSREPLAPIVLYKKGKVGIYERQAFISKLTKTIDLHIR